MGADITKQTVANQPSEPNKPLTNAMGNGKNTIVASKPHKNSPVIKSGPLV